MNAVIPHKPIWHFMAMGLCHSLCKVSRIFSTPWILNLNWPCNFLWPTEHSKSDDVRFLYLSLRRSWLKLLLSPSHLESDLWRSHKKDIEEHYNFSLSYSGGKGQLQGFLLSHLPIIGRPCGDFSVSKNVYSNSQKIPPAGFVHLLGPLGDEIK